MPQPLSPSKAETGENLPRITSSLSGVELVNALETAARRGKLPGFERGNGEVGFEIADFGTPWESVLEARTRPLADAGEQAGCEVGFSLRMKRGMAWVYAIVLIVTVWPGVWLTDTMLRTYSSTYAGWPAWVTWAWYLPLTVPFVPVAMWQAWRKSRQTAREEAGELIAKVRKLVGNQDGQP
ncbi:MAG TPA: hypothetical protein VHC70_10070 [Phycisphaerales bacterium]|nr:hypothetical protein [Phycisphaerales bacterium]